MVAHPKLIVSLLSDYRFDPSESGLSAIIVLTKPKPYKNKIWYFSKVPREDPRAMACGIVTQGIN